MASLPGSHSHHEKKEEAAHCFEKWHQIRMRRKMEERILFKRLKNSTSFWEYLSFIYLFIFSRLRFKIGKIIESEKMQYFLVYIATTNLSR
jgi:hypothetical protein